MLAQTALVVGVGVALATSTAQAGETWFGFVDENGVVNITDTRNDPRARAFDAETFETMALRQQAAPHRGRSLAGRAMVVTAAEQKVLPLLVEKANAHGVDAALIRAVVAVESGFNPTAKSRVGALGLMQLMPATARELGVNPRVPEENVEGGTRYLAGLLKMFGDERLALAAYNAGPGRVRRAGGIPNITETKRYVRNVLQLRAHYLRWGTAQSGHLDVDKFAAGAPHGR